MQISSAYMILLLFVLVCAHAALYYSPYSSVSHDPMEGTKEVDASLPVLETKHGAVTMVPPQPVPSMPQPLPIEVIDSSTGQKLGTQSIIRVSPTGYPQFGVPPYSIQYLTFDGNLVPYGR
ncbi:hypothetical protein GCK32_019052 [Trichostrongylus colubriformis]|uniref:Uncharacterized protein n=1 Tax=Trichostrongylus colubriformis TaxID=6319 RepID=A0AAN8FC79_TRICO